MRLACQTLIAAVCIVACSRRATEPKLDEPRSAVSTKVAARSNASVTGAESGLVFTGMCDASAAVPLSPRLFAVADDEDNVLRAYDAHRGGAPIWSVDVSSSIGLVGKPLKPGKQAKGPPEADLEAATRVGDVAFWLSSHGRNSSGKVKSERLKLFATTTSTNGAEIRVTGAPYERLLVDLLADPRLSKFDLAAAAERAPKSPGGLNIEGMTARAEGGVWIGFRNPIPEGKALLLPLLNPEELTRGSSAKFGDPITLDLAGLGVRSISSFRGRYLIAAGHFASGGSSRLYTWDGKNAATLLDKVRFADFNPEGFFTPEEQDRILVLSDDGSRRVDGVECKKLRDASRKHFRAVWLKL